MNIDIYRQILAGEPVLFPLANRSLWKLSGPDATRYLNGQVTNDVTLLADQTAFRAAVCTAKGRMEGDVFIANHADSFYLDADPSLREGLGARLDKFLIADDALLEDIADGWTLHHLFGATAPVSDGESFAVANPRYGMRGYDLWAPATGAAPKGITADAATIEILRLENGIPRWGAELTANTLPPEAGPRLLEAISYTKGCYVGQETIARLKSVGHVNRTLVFMKADAASFPAPAEKLYLEGKEVGAVTSAGFSPRFESGVALGYVSRAMAVAGTTLQANDLRLTVADWPALEF